MWLPWWDENPKTIHCGNAVVLSVAKKCILTSVSTLSEVSSHSGCKVNFRLSRVMESTNTVVQLRDIAVHFKWKPRSISCHIIFRSADLCFSLGLTLTQCMNGIIIKKTSESLAETKEHDFLAKISHVWGYEWGRGERSRISHGNVSFGLNLSEIQWSISVALCFPRAVHCFFGQIKYCNSLTSPRSPIKFKGSIIHSSPLPSWRHFPLWYPSSSLTPHYSSRVWLQIESLAWEEWWHFKPLAGGEKLEDSRAIVSLCLHAMCWGWP